MAIKHVLFVTKDVGGYNAVKLVYDALARMGHTSQVYAEGVSMERWLDADKPVTFNGTKNFLQEPFSFNAREELQKDLPDVVVVTMGSPINMENDCAIAAKEFGIPLVIVEDVWGTHARTRAVPDLMFTIDSFGQSLIQKDTRYEHTRVLIAGNAGVNNLAIPNDLRERMDALRFQHGRLILFCGEGDGTADLLRVALGSLMRVNEEFVLIPRFHPKHAGDPIKMSAWNGMLDLFERQSLCAATHVLRLDDVKNTDALAALCDVTISGCSTTLMHAAKHGRLAVSVDTPLTRSLLSPQVGGMYERFPGIDLGYAIHLENDPVCNLFEPLMEQAAMRRAAAKHAFASIPVEAMAAAIVETAR